MTENLEKIVEQSFLDYGAFILQRRAIPDARDCFKYTARQIIHAQSREKLDHKHPIKKSQKSASAATSFSYVHGGTSAYEQIIRMGRPLVQRYFLEEILGNGGTPTGSSTYAAERYTDARLSELTDHILRYLNMETLNKSDWEPTYDEEGVFPKVFPSVGYYNICNGSFGSIGVGLVSSIPQFNLRETNTVICQLIDDPDIEVSLTPDFASGGILLNPQTTRNSLARGEGKSALIRGVIKQYPENGYLEVLEVPYGVYTDTICIELEKALEDESAPFTSFKDLSKSNVKLRIYGENLDEIEKWLYKNTSVQKHFTIKLTMLDNGKTPRQFTLKEALLAHIDHARTMYRNQYIYQLEQLQIREEIIRGLQKAHSILDDVITTVRASQGRADVIKNLTLQYGFTPRQAESIAEIKTHRWSSLDIAILQKELDANLITQENINILLNDKIKFDLELKTIYAEIAAKFGDSRRTKIGTSDKWEFGCEGGKPTKDFWLIKTIDGEYLVTYSDEVDNKLSGTRVEPDEDLIFVSNTLRGFLRKGSTLSIGDLNLKKELKLADGEEIICIIKKSELAQFEFMQIRERDKKPYELHQSYLSLGATVRGKKICGGEHDVQEIELVGVGST